MKIAQIQFAAFILLLAPLTVHGIEIQESVDTTKKINTTTKISPYSKTMLAQLQFHLLVLKQVLANHA